MWGAELRVLGEVGVSGCDWSNQGSALGRGTRMKDKATEDYTFDLFDNFSQAQPRQGSPSEKGPGGTPMAYKPWVLNMYVSALLT